MGESDGDVVRMAFALRDLNVESIPVNFLNPIDGTPLAGVRQPQSAVLPEGAGHVPFCQSIARDPHFGRP